MTAQYSFLNDELAILEIRKHKWIESEKHGHEIGFATAAVDWVKKYGAAWKQARLGPAGQPRLFSEKRLHRRFAVQFPVQVSADKISVNCQTNDVSLIGLSCTVPQPLPPDSPAEVIVRFKEKNQPRSQFRFKSRVTHVSQPDGKNGYNIFLPFSEDVRDYLRMNEQLLNN